MIGALELVLSGGIYIPPEILVRGALALSNSAEKQVAIDRLRVSPADCGLTERQVEVLALMTQGKINKAIGRVLALAEPTVKNHIAAILKALKVKNRTGARWPWSSMGGIWGGTKSRNGYRRLQSNVGKVVVVLLQELAQHGAQCPRTHRLVQHGNRSRAPPARVWGPCRR